MKRISLITTLFLGLLLLENCKKDTITATATSSSILFASINDSLWNADTVKAAITYSSASKAKAFTCTGIADNKEINMLVSLSNALNTAGFTIGSYNVNAVTDTIKTITYSLMSYDVAVKNSVGVNVFIPTGTVFPGSGTVAITAIDSVKKLITGTFSLTSLKNNYDSNGNIISFHVDQVFEGAFNSMPYTFTSN